MNLIRSSFLVIALGLSACTTSNVFGKGYCNKSTSGHTVCIKKQNIFCKKVLGHIQSCNAAGIMTDLRGQNYHWSTSENEAHIMNDNFGIGSGPGVNCDEWVNYSFTCNAARHFGMSK